MAWMVQDTSSANKGDGLRRSFQHEQPGQALRVGADDFDRSKIPAERLQKAEQAWRSLVTTCQGVALDLVVEAQSPGEAWAALTAYYDTGTQGKRRRLRQELHDTSMKLRENPAEFTQRVDQIVHELRHLGANVDEEEVTSVILKGLTDEYQDARKLLLDAEEELTRTNIERVLQQRFESIGRDQEPFRGTRVMAVKAVAKCSQEHMAAEHESHFEQKEPERIQSTSTRKGEGVEGVYVLYAHVLVTQHSSVNAQELKRGTRNAGTAGQKDMNNGTVQRSVRARGGDVVARSVAASVTPHLSATLL